MSVRDDYLGLPADLVRRHFRVIVVALLALWVASAEFGLALPNLPSIPLWVKVLLVFAGLFSVVGYLAGSYLFDDLDPEWRYVYQVSVDEETTVRAYQATEEVVEDVDVIGADSLPRVPGTERHYYCRFFNEDPEEPMAHVTWNEVASDADLLGTKPSDIEQEVGFMRDAYEGEIRKADHLRNHISVILRILNRKKAENLNAALDDHLSPSFGGDEIDDIIDDVVPDDLLPENFESRLDDAMDDHSPDVDPEEVARDVADDLDDDLEESEDDQPEIETEEPPALPSDD